MAPHVPHVPGIPQDQIRWNDKTTDEICEIIASGRGPSRIEDALESVWLHLVERTAIAEAAARGTTSHPSDLYKIRARSFQSCARILQTLLEYYHDHL